MNKYKERKRIENKDLTSLSKVKGESFQIVHFREEESLRPSVNDSCEPSYPEANEKQVESNTFHQFVGYGEGGNDLISGNIVSRFTETSSRKEKILKTYSPKIEDFASFEDYLDALVSYDKKNFPTTEEISYHVNRSIDPLKGERNVSCITATNRASSK